MRAMWKGAVAFGLVNVPIKLYAATEDHDVRFHQVHAADGGRVKMQRTCSLGGHLVDYKDLGKAYETESGQVVIMDEADFDGLPVPGVREIEVLEFVPSDQVDPVLFDRSYYLEPDPKALKPYVLLREALKQTERTALVRVVLRHKTQLAALRVRGDVLVMQTMLWPDEVREADFDVLDTDVAVRDAELAMAASLIDSLSSDFDPSEYRDEYREALLAVIEDKLAGGEGVVTPDVTASDDGGEAIVVDLMAALRESVQRTQQARETVADAAAPDEADTPPARVAAPAKAKAPRKPSAAKPSAAKSGAAAKATKRSAAGSTATEPAAASAASTAPAESKPSRRKTA
jgi:DNA end-binding protein Ku